MSYHQVSILSLTLALLKYLPLSQIAGCQSVRASRQNENNPEYVVSIQPDNHNTPNDIQLKLKSLGYAPTLLAIRDLESAVWADFEVQTNGIAFNLSSTVSAVDPPEPERYDEPATDEELPF